MRDNMMIMTRVGQNIRTIRNQRKLSQAKMAELCGWENPSRLSNYENTEREPSLSDIRLMANILQVSPATLAFDDYAAAIDLPYPRIHGLPLLDWGQACDWPFNKKELVEKQALDFVGSHVSFGPNCFALKVEDDLMKSYAEAKSFQEGTYVIVDIDRRPKDRSFIIAKQNNTNRLMLRQYRKDADGYEYLSLLKDNHPRPHVDLTSDIKIVGIVVAHLDLLV